MRGLAVSMILCLLMTASAGVVPTEGFESRAGDQVAPGSAEDADLYFFEGYWWYFKDNSWYRSADYNGSWSMVELAMVPDPVKRLNKNLRKMRKRPAQGSASLL